MIILRKDENKLTQRGEKYIGEKAGGKYSYRYLLTFKKMIEKGSLAGISEKREIITRTPLCDHTKNRFRYFKIRLET